MESNISLITPRELKWVNNKPSTNSNVTNNNVTNNQRRENYYNNQGKSTHTTINQDYDKGNYMLTEGSSHIDTHLEDNIINTITTIQDRVDINIDRTTILNTLHDCLVFVQNNKIRQNVQIHKKVDDRINSYNHLAKDTKKDKQNNNIHNNNIIKTYRHKPFITTVKTDIESSMNTKNDTQLTLVENNKPHPRMRRKSDNPNTNEFVRVFQLQKKK